MKTYLLDNCKEKLHILLKTSNQEWENLRMCTHITDNKHEEEFCSFSNSFNPDWQSFIVTWRQTQGGANITDYKKVYYHQCHLIQTWQSNSVTWRQNQGWYKHYWLQENVLSVSFNPDLAVTWLLITSMRGKYAVSVVHFTSRPDSHTLQNEDQTV